jgi:hypothetical protein
MSKDNGSIPVIGQPAQSANVDVVNRVVTFQQMRPLDIRPTEISVPFAALKATVGQIIMAEAQQEAGGGIKAQFTQGQTQGPPA